MIFPFSAGGLWPNLHNYMVYSVAELFVLYSQYAQTAEQKVRRCFPGYLGFLLVFDLFVLFSPQRVDKSNKSALNRPNGENPEIAARGVFFPLKRC